ncbi:MAG: hypothetical protein PHY29_02835 [Syntrophales bacterium]|nr:hypothetical protein [Syntrophales bacterium]
MIPGDDLYSGPHKRNVWAIGYQDLVIMPDFEGIDYLSQHNEARLRLDVQVVLRGMRERRTRTK